MAFSYSFHHALGERNVPPPSNMVHQCPLCKKKLATSAGGARRVNPQKTIRSTPAITKASIKHQPTSPHTTSPTSTLGNTKWKWNTKTASSCSGTWSYEDWPWTTKVRLGKMSQWIGDESPLRTSFTAIKKTLYCHLSLSSPAKPAERLSYSHVAHLEASTTK